jgi:hypothetical protein
MTTKKLLVTPGHVLTMRKEIVYYEGYQHAINSVLGQINRYMEPIAELNDQEKQTAIAIRMLVKKLSREIVDAG